MLLQDKNAVIYGAGGGIGGAVARTFAREGATVFLTGRRREPLDALAAEISGAGGAAEVAVVDALDEQAVEEHARQVDRIDISFNLISRGDVQGAPLVDMSVEDFTQPVTNGLRSMFLTARAAARRMGEQGSGVILSVTSGSAKGASPMMGGTGPADGAVEVFLRNLAVEMGPRGVRVVGIHTAGVVETMVTEKLVEVNPDVPSPEQIIEMLSSMTLLKRAPRLAEVAETAAFLASDRASGITSTIVNVTCGLVVG